MIKYSFIIPHHNSPKLLLRCINSIPQREDVEIIVVDDNSDEELKPIVDRSDTSLFFIGAEATKGAGRARNHGIEEAKGKWLLFADADDYYAEGFLDKIDNTIHDDTEVLYFDIYSNVEGRNNRATNSNIIFSKYRTGHATDEDVKFLIWGPWNKVVSRNFIEKYNLRYEEIPSGNDAFFSFYAAQKVNSYLIIQDRLYCLTNNPQSITYKTRTLEKEMSTLAQNIRIHKFIESETSCHLNMPVCYRQNIKNVYRQGGWYALLGYIKFINREYSVIKTFMQILQYINR